MFFIVPLVKSLGYSFRNIDRNIFGGFCGLANYKKAFMGDEVYAQRLVEVLKSTALKTPLILIFSLFAAVLLNQKFRGRALARAIFFLPVIIATGPVYNIITGNISTSAVSSAAQFSTMFKTDITTRLLNFIGIYGLSDTVAAAVQSVTTDVFGLVWNSGIQILIFLARLQNIPVSVRESAMIEGATAWEYFWKITIPYVSPVILINLVFTIIDSFTDPSNAVMERILVMQKDWQYGLSAAMAWAYFGIVIAALGIVYAIANKLVFYEFE